MARSSWWLFLAPVAIWSTTYYAITFQLNSVTPEIFAVSLRFLIASVIIFFYLRAKKVSANIGKPDHLLAAASGLLAYAVSYQLTYLSERAIPSGLVAIAFTLMVFFTPLLAWLAYRHRISRRTWIGGSLGVLGVSLCFGPSLAFAGHTSLAPWAVASMLGAAFASSAAAVISMRLNDRKVPVAVYTAWAMLYGALAAAAYGFASGESLRWDVRPAFWIAFAYLAVFGSAVAFLCYLELLRREGAAHAMYVSVLSPIGAVGISHGLENLRLSGLALLGIVCALAGAWHTLRSKH